MYEQGAGAEQGNDGGLQPGGDAGVIYELDLGGGEDAAGQEAPAAAPAPAPIPQPDPRDLRIAQLEASQAAINAELTPLAAQLRARQRAEAERPPIDPSRIDTDPNIKPSDLLRLIDWQQRQSADQISAQTRREAAAILSEQHARGVFTAAELGQGNDYDSMVNRHVAPLVAQNPAIDQLIAIAAPGNPAVGRMIFATIVAALERSNGDELKAIKSVMSGLDAYATGARDTVQAQQRAAKVAAANVLPGSTAAAGLGKRAIKSADDVWNLKPEEFDRFYNAAGR